MEKTSTLDEQLSGIIGRKRKFILLRISGLDLTTSLNIVGATRNSYGKWTMEDKFNAVYTRWEELASDYRDEAIRLLRKENQLAATLLEREVIDKMREEVASGELNITKTQLGREVYSKLISELDKPIEKITLTWEQRILQFQQNAGLLNQGEIIDGDVIAETGKATQCDESSIIEETIQSNAQNLQEGVSPRDADTEEESDSSDGDAAEA